MKAFFTIVFTAFLSTFGHIESNHYNSLVTTWIRYDELVNGYEVIIYCTQKEPNSSYFDTEVYLTKKGKAAFIHQTINFDDWKPWQLQGVTEKDTVVIQNTHVSQHIDWTNILYFEDMDFDGEEELVVCGYPRPNRPLEGEDYIDCEDFTIYQKRNLVFFRFTTWYLMSCLKACVALGFRLIHHRKQSRSLVSWVMADLSQKRFISIMENHSRWFIHTLIMSVPNVMIISLNCLMRLINTKI